MTEREIVLRERRAFVAGSNAENEAWMRTLRVNHTSGFDSIAASRAAYPLPKITRPRVVFDNTGRLGAVEWRCVDGTLEYRFVDHRNEWKHVNENGGHTGNMFITAARVKLLADLLANPNETVEE